MERLLSIMQQQAFVLPVGVDAAWIRMKLPDVPHPCSPQYGVIAVFAYSRLYGFGMLWVRSSLAW